MDARRATPGDAGVIADIYNQGIGDRMATFETGLRSPEDVRASFNHQRHPIVVVEESGGVITFAATFPYRPRECSAGVPEFASRADARCRPPCDDGAHRCSEGGGLLETGLSALRREHGQAEAPSLGRLWRRRYLRETREGRRDRAGRRLRRAADPRAAIVRPTATTPPN